MRIEYSGFSRLLFLIFTLNILMAQLLHEAGHWLVMQVYGHHPVWGYTSLVQLWDRAPRNPAEWLATTSLEGNQGWLYLASSPVNDLEWLLFIVAGPIMQLVAIMVGLILAKYGRSPAVRTIGFLAALINAFGGFFYQVVNLLQGVGGDEALIAYYLGVSPVIISTVLAAAFGLGLVITFRAVETWKMRLTLGTALMIGIVPVGPLLMLANRAVIEQVDAGNPFFQPVIGFSLPVFLTGAICFLVISFIAQQWQDIPSNA